MTPVEAVVAIIGTLFLAGGPLATYINARAAANKKPITIEQAEVKEIERIAADLGIEERWKKYADEVELRLSIRIEELDQALELSRKRLDRVIGYSWELRSHIQRELPPPPPRWPENIN